MGWVMVTSYFFGLLKLLSAGKQMWEWEFLRASKGIETLLLPLHNLGSNFNTNVPNKRCGRNRETKYWL